MTQFDSSADSAADLRLDRRSFLRGSMLGAAGLCAAPMGAPLRLLQNARTDAPAHSVIQIFLTGGLSHIDSFDPKPSAPVEYRGEYRTVKSKLDGEYFTHVIPRIAAIADKLTVIRSMTHGEAAHERGIHNMMTGYRPSPVITYPSMGSVVAHELGGRNNLPAYVCVPSGGQFRGTGYLSAAYAPFELGAEPNSRNFKVRDMTTPTGVDPDRLARRRALVAEIDSEFDKRGKSDAVEASAAFYDQAYELIGSEAGRAAFDLDKEPAKLRDRYGRTTLGQRLLLARRLAEAGVRFIHVQHAGYDNHRRIFPTLRTRLAEVDRAFSTLIADLDSRGSLENTLVLLTTEFGRTPKVNRDAGRDHWPRVFSVVLAGGGVKRGYIHGSSTATGAEPATDPVTAPDLAATVFTQVGIDPSHELMSPGDRPIEIVRDARIVRDLLA